MKKINKFLIYTFIIYPISMFVIYYFMDIPKPEIMSYYWGLVIGSGLIIFNNKKI